MRSYRYEVCRKALKRRLQPRRWRSLPFWTRRSHDHWRTRNLSSNGLRLAAGAYSILRILNTKTAIGNTSAKALMAKMKTIFSDGQIPYRAMALVYLVATFLHDNGGGEKMRGVYAYLSLSAPLGLCSEIKSLGTCRLKNWDRPWHYQVTERLLSLAFISSKLAAFRPTTFVFAF